MKTKDELIDWLRDAYAMERGLEVTLQKQSKDEGLNELFRQQINVHLAETTEHAELVEACLKSLGSDVSSLKSGLAQTMETVKGVGTAFTRDERVKDLLAAYGSEHFEIACYKALRVAAEFIGETDVVKMCDAILPDEKRMAAWLDENLPGVVQSYLASQADKS